MTTARHQELISALLEGRASLAAQDELAAAAAGDAELLATVRQQLLLDEVLSQLSAPERSVEAFIDGLHEHERIDSGQDQFLVRMRAALARQRRGPEVARNLLIQSSVLALAASIAIAASTLVLGWMHEQAQELEPLFASSSQLAGVTAAYPSRAARAFHEANGLHE